MTLTSFEAFAISGEGCNALEISLVTTTGDKISDLRSALAEYPGRRGCASFATPEVTPRFLDRLGA